MAHIDDYGVQDAVICPICRSNVMIEYLRYKRSSGLVVGCCECYEDSPQEAIRRSAERAERFSQARARAELSYDTSPTEDIFGLAIVFAVLAALAFVVVLALV